ncbi:MAG: hypothetical protein ABR562_07420, partial [Thermoplasmatota archaeon]
MKANRFAAREDGVSNVLGAILVFGLFVVTLVTIQTQFVPVWQKQREGALMEDVARQMGAIKSGLDRQVGNQTQVPISEPLSMRAAEGFALFQEHDRPGTLTFGPAGTGAGLAVSSNQLTIVQKNGQDLYGLAEQWVTVAGGSISSITDVVHLRTRVTDPENTNAGTMTVLFTDANGKCGGRLVTEVFVSGSDRTIEDRVYGPTQPASGSCNATPITIRDTDAKKQTNPAYYYVDAFDPELLFRSVLAALTFPATVTFTTVTLAGDYNMVYDTVTGGNNVGGTGLVIIASSSATGASVAGWNGGGAEWSVPVKGSAETATG